MSIREIISEIEGRMILAGAIVVGSFIGLYMGVLTASELIALLATDGILLKILEKPT
uniref:Uncharacterized protein n=1 Tax=viral metagenome TaxID=1070528 RepID=A0A6M3J9U0_9ZZZZ